MKTYKILIIILISLLFIVTRSGSSFAAWTSGSYFKLEASGTKFDVSDGTFTVDVYANDKAGHAGGIIPVEWPEEAFQVVKISNDKGFYKCSRVTVPLPDKDGRIVLFFDGSLELQNKSGSGKVATLTFQINDGASPGEKEIEFGEVDLFDTVAFCDDYPDASDLHGVTITLTDKNAPLSEQETGAGAERQEETAKKEIQPEKKTETAEEQNKKSSIQSGEKTEDKSSGGAAGTQSAAVPGSGSSKEAAVSGGGASSAGSSEKKNTQTYSKNWYADANGVWRIKNSKGNIVKSAWVCDDAVPQNGKNVWYLMNPDGSMLAAGLLQDATGNWYSLETNHDGYYGMLRYEDGYYNCNGTKVFLKFEHEHNGSFGAIKNLTAVDKLKKIYGVTAFPAGNESIVYTATF